MNLWSVLIRKIMWFSTLIATAGWRYGVCFPDLFWGLSCCFVWNAQTAFSLMIKLYNMLSKRSIISTVLMSHSFTLCLKLYHAILQWKVQQEFGRIILFSHSADTVKCGGESTVSRGGMNVFESAQYVMEPETWCHLLMCSHAGSSVFCERIIFLCLHFKAAVDLLPFHMNHCLHVFWVCSRQPGMSGM